MAARTAALVLLLLSAFVCRRSEALRCYQCRSNIPVYDRDCESNPRKLSAHECPPMFPYCQTIHTRHLGTRFMYSTTRSCAVEPMFINNEPEDVSYYYCDTNLCNTASTRQLAGVLTLLALPFFIVF